MCDRRQSAFRRLICPSSKQLEKTDYGKWDNMTLKFTTKFGKRAGVDEYPFYPPKTTLNPEFKLYHPNISLENEVCLGLKRDNMWKATMDIKTVCWSLFNIFNNPNPDDPLNHEAATLMREDITKFNTMVRTTLRGTTKGDGTVKPIKLSVKRG